jgi:uncharacterized protein
MQNDYDRRTTHRHKLAPLLPTGAARERRLRLYLLAVCNHLVGGLALTGLVAYIAHDSGLDQALARTLLFWPIVLLPVAFAILAAAALENLGEETAQALFWAYAILIGLSLGSVLPVLAGVPIAPAFLAMAISIGTLSLYGHLTEDPPLTPAALLIAVLAGVVDAALVGWSSECSALLFIISVAGVLLLVGLTACRMNRIRHLDRQFYPHDDPSKGSIKAAFGLYLDALSLVLFRTTATASPAR